MDTKLSEVALKYPLLRTTIGPEDPLPHTDDFATTEEYIESLLDFVGSNELLRTLCGGVHILDFFTSSPPIYEQVLPEEWRSWFSHHEVMDILDLLMREDLKQFENLDTTVESRWRDGPSPPSGLLDFIRTVRKHLLVREPRSSQCSRNRSMKPVQKLARHVAVGMNVKKVHEVGLFASYLDRLTSTFEDSRGFPISHLVDFGSGQNYLGRALASEPYNKNIVAIESKQANAERAKEFDVMAKLATKEKLMRNKKAFRDGLEGPETGVVPQPVLPVNLPTPPESSADEGDAAAPAVEVPTTGSGTIQYIEHRIQDGDLEGVIARIPAAPKNLMIMSLHSCGNLVHHGLRATLLNPSVKLVALVGCCYNLLTECLGPATYKHPSLRPAAAHTADTNANDPHGFPMSARLCTYYANTDRGVRLNITARMMAVQAPANWGATDSARFFTRHFYRALLQRILLDRGLVPPPRAPAPAPAPDGVAGSVSPAGHTSGGTPIVIGSLRKACYASFAAYVAGAREKLGAAEPAFAEGLAGLGEAEIEGYVSRYGGRKGEVSVLWSLMAFCAGVIEAVIVVDRWLWLREQEGIAEAWVEPVFAYGMSPRNLVVVGVKG